MVDEVKITARHKILQAAYEQFEKSHAVVKNMTNRYAALEHRKVVERWRKLVEREQLKNPPKRIPTDEEILSYQIYKLFMGHSYYSKRSLGGE